MIFFLYRESFYDSQLFLIGKEQAYFDKSIFDLLENFNTRADIFLPRKIRIMIQDVLPSYGIKINSNKKDNTYIRLSGVKKKLSLDDNSIIDSVYQIKDTQISIEEYFKKWEMLIIELQKMIY